MVDLVNLTPHSITIVGVGTLKPSGTVARITVVSDAIKVIDTQLGSVTLLGDTLGDIIDLPAPVKDTFYIVSRMVKDASDRKDLLSPGKLVRNDKGQPVGCQDLSWR